MPDGSQPWALQLLELHPGSLDGVQGFFQGSNAFEPDPSEVARFDATFPTKARFRTRSQAAFEKALCLSYGDPIPDGLMDEARSLEPVSSGSGTGRAMSGQR
jgi:hypothetical protein